MFAAGRVVASAVKRNARPTRPPVWGRRGRIEATTPNPLPARPESTESRRLTTGARAKNSRPTAHPTPPDERRRPPRRQPTPPPIPQIPGTNHHQTRRHPHAPTTQPPTRAQRRALHRRRRARLHQPQQLGELRARAVLAVVGVVGDERAAALEAVHGGIEVVAVRDDVVRRARKVAPLEQRALRPRDLRTARDARGVRGEGRLAVDDRRARDERDRVRRVRRRAAEGDGPLACGRGDMTQTFCFAGCPVCAHKRMSQRPPHPTGEACENSTCHWPNLA